MNAPTAAHPSSGRMSLLATTVTLIVADPAKSADFFVAHFGFQMKLTFDGGAAVEHPHGGSTLFFLREGLPVLAHSLCQGRTQGLILAFTVADIEAELARLGRGGVTWDTDIEQDDWGERHAQLRDPNGLVIQLVQWIDARPY